MHPGLAFKPAELAQRSGHISPLSPAHIGLVRATFQILSADRDRLTEMFYARACALDPNFQKPQLVSNMIVQRMQVMLVLSEVVQQLDNPPGLAKIVADLIRRQGMYGTSDPRFRTARAALAWAIDRILESERDSAIHVAWTAAFDLVEALVAGGIPSDR